MTDNWYEMNKDGRIQAFKDIEAKNGTILALGITTNEAFVFHNNEYFLSMDDFKKTNKIVKIEIAKMRDNGHPKFADIAYSKELLTSEHFVMIKKKFDQLANKEKENIA